MFKDQCTVYKENIIVILKSKKFTSWKIGTYKNFKFTKRGCLSIANSLNFQPLNYGLA